MGHDHLPLSPSVVQTILYELVGGWSRAKALDALAPTHLVMPTGTRILVDYSREQPTVSVRIQVCILEMDRPFHPDEPWP